MFRQNQANLISLDAQLELRVSINRFHCYRGFGSYGSSLPCCIGFGWWFFYFNYYVQLSKSPFTLNKAWVRHFSSWALEPISLTKQFVASKNKNLTRQEVYVGFFNLGVDPILHSTDSWWLMAGVIGFSCFQANIVTMRSINHHQYALFTTSQCLITSYSYDYCL